jgi:hypothetical protein
MRKVIYERRIHLLVAATVAALVATMVILMNPISSATATTATTLKICEEANSYCAFSVGETWQQVKSDKASGGTYRVSRSTTEPAVFRPTDGPEINLVTATGPTRGIAKVTVWSLCDPNPANPKVVKVVKFNLNTDTSHYKVVKRITGLQPDRMHAVTVVSADGKPVVVDAFKGTPVSNAGHIDHHDSPPST